MNNKAIHFGRGVGCDMTRPQQNFPRKLESTFKASPHFNPKAGQGNKILQIKEESVPLGFTFFSLMQKKGKRLLQLAKSFL